MELVPKKRLLLLSGRSNLPLAEDIARNLGVELGETGLGEFADGEIHCRFGESIRGSDCFIIQTHCRPVNDWIMEQLIMIDAAKRASAKRITAVCPYYGYSRQDRKSSGREPITAKLVADMLTAAGVDRVVSVDLHSGQIQGFFDVPVDHLPAMPILIKWVEDNLGRDVVVVSPDAGRAKLADRFARHLNATLAIVDKRRTAGTGEAVALGVMGDVAGRVCVLVDDQVSTAGTICAAAEMLVKRGAADVYVVATHGIFADPAIDRIKNSVITRVVVTDTVPLSDDRRIDKIEVLSVAGIIADALKAVFEDTSVSEIFGGENQS
ncbi:MAG: ribose-phosphate diphosphokinase [Acidimicrobiales bacterium]